MRKAWRGTLWTLGILALLVAAAAAAPFLVPLDRFLPDLAKLASDKLGQPVSIAGLRLQLLPTPRAVANGISVGKKSEVSIGELEIVPDLLSFVSGPKVVRLVRAERVAVKEGALAFASTMPKGEGGGEDITVRRVELLDVALQHSAVKLPPFDVRAELGDKLALVQAYLQTRDNALRVRYEPQAEGISRIALEATEWTLPAGPPIRFEWLAAEGTLKGKTADFPKLEARLYGGKLAGSVRADWTKLWQISGRAALSGVDVAPLQVALGKKVQLTGRLNTDARFSARARTPQQLADALVLDSPFEVVGGAYQGYDLSKMSLTKLEAGGSTPFEELTGNVAVRAKQIRIAKLCARSPTLVAGGNVNVAPDQKLSGKLDVSVSKTGGFVGIPVSLGGTTSAPSFSPTKGYVIGTVIGTVLLPGIGTALGASAGSRLEGTSDCK